MDRNVLTLVLGFLLIAIAFVAMDYYDFRCQVRANSALIERLKAEQRPLNVISGKYPCIYTSKGEVLVATEEDVLIREEGE